jgi:hypothetical protein
LGDQDVATAEQFKRLFTPVAAVVRATQQPVVEEAVAANTMHTVVEEVVAAAVAPPDWMEVQDEPDVVQDEDPLEEQDALLEEQDYLLALLDRWMVVEDCAHQPMEVEDEELLQATAERQAELLRDAHRDALQAAAERGPTKRGRPLCASPDSKGNSTWARGRRTCTATLAQGAARRRCWPRCSCSSARWGSKSFRCASG